MFQCSSASRKFLTGGYGALLRIASAFQCSSASRKFLTVHRIGVMSGHLPVSVLFSEPKIPHRDPIRQRHRQNPGFSALQRAENSSRCSASRLRSALIVSVLFSEPKIPHEGVDARGDLAEPCFSALQRAENSSHYPRPRRAAVGRVSVLFSEPKIPHRRVRHRCVRLSAFQCSSASRKFLTRCCDG